MKTLFVFMIFAIILVMLDQCQCDPSPQSITLLQTDSEAAKPIGQRIANGMSIIGHDISTLFSCPDEVNGRGARCWWNKRGIHSVQ